MIDVREQLTDDAAAVVMLCSRLGLGGDGEPGRSPLTLREWNALARRIHDSELRRPGALLGISAADISKRLEIPDAEAEAWPRWIAGGAVALALEQLPSGYLVRLRVDECILPRIVKASIPAVLFGAATLNSG